MINKEYSMMDYDISKFNCFCTQWAKNGKNSEEKNVRTVTVDDMTHEYDNLLTKAFNST